MALQIVRDHATIELLDHRMNWHVLLCGAVVGLRNEVFKDSVLRSEPLSTNVLAYHALTVIRLLNIALFRSRVEL